MILFSILSAIALYRGGGSGLSLYLHYAYSVDLDGMFSGAEHPQALFRFLPLYTVVAGAIGFAIGWIVGRNV
jgi:hypothetical protein